MDEEALGEGDCTALEGGDCHVGLVGFGRWEHCGGGEEEGEVVGGNERRGKVWEESLALVWMGL